MDATDAAVIFDNTRTLSWQASSQSSWTVTLGTKIGTGNKASGINGGFIAFGAATTMRGTINLYGGKSKITTGALSWSPGITNAAGTGEAINWLFQSASAGVAPLIFGVNGQPIANVYNVDISSTTSNQMLSNFFAVSAERITIGGSSALSYVQSGSAALSAKDIALFGSPSNAQLRWATGSGIDWVIVRPTWISGKTKFSTVGALDIAIGDAAVEYWIYDVKCVDSAGAGVASIPVKVTDNAGNVQINTTTDSNGAISYGSGLTANALAMMDHYATSGTYLQRHRGPFLTEVNLSTMSGYNQNYRSHKYLWYPPGYESVTTTSGTFEDVTDIIQMQAYPGTQTIWAECEGPTGH